MDSIFGFFQDSVAFAVPMIVLLGLLIFVHELGHFLVAKYYKVRVEVFSLGFGPKLLKFKRGDTTYAISAIPLGGYVKMFGDDPTAQITGPDRAVAFNHKPVGQRIAVVLAGPIMNLLFAFVVFMILAGIGEPMTPAPQIGDLETSSAAYQAGFRAGDKVLTADGKQIRTWEQLQQSIEANPEEPVKFEVDRGGKNIDVTATPKRAPNKNVMSWSEEVGAIDGLSFMSRASAVGVEDPSSPAATAGIKSGDEIVSVNGNKLDKWRDLLTSFNAAASTNEQIKLELRRRNSMTDTETTKVDAVLTVPAAAKGKTDEQLLKVFGLENPELYLAGFDQPKLGVREKFRNQFLGTKFEAVAPAKKAGLKVGDKLLAIDGKPLSKFDEVVSIIRSHDDETKPLYITYLRDGKKSEAIVQPNVKERMSSNLKEEKRIEIGISPMIEFAEPATTVWKAQNAGELIERGISQTGKWTSVTVLGFFRLFERKVSAKNIGGLFSIGQMAQKSWEVGVSPFMWVMALISLNLFILNLLPVPVLDGGHLTFFIIESIKGAPLSLKKMEIAQMVGITLLFSLMAFAFFNDFSRYFGGS